MFMNDVNKQEEIRNIAVQDLKHLGIKYRHKKHRLQSQEMKSRKVFKTHLHQLPTRTVTLTSGQQMAIPKIVSELCAFIVSRANTEGLFRKGGAKSRQNEIRLALDAGCGVSDEYHEIDVASVLKTFFRELPEPLIPHAYHDLYMRCVILDSCHRLNAVLNASLLLPIEHLNSLTFFMQFLHHISEFSDMNKMDSYNLAVIFGPTLLPSDDKLVPNVTYRLTKTTELFQLLIDNSMQIGTLSEHIIGQIALDMSGILHEDFDKNSGGGSNRVVKSSKKKRRSGSLTRMFNGLKKIVGAKETPQITSTATPDILLSTPIITRSQKKERDEPGGLSVKKKQELVKSLPQGTTLSTPLRPLTLNVKSKSTPEILVKTGTKSNCAKAEKKTQWYSRSKNRNNVESAAGANSGGPVTTTSSSTSSLSRPRLMLERRWSAVSQVAAFKRSNRKQQQQQRSSCASSSSSNSSAGHDRQSKPIIVVPEKLMMSLATDASPFQISHVVPLSVAAAGSSNPVQTCHLADDYGFVRIPRNEYEEIKGRVAAIERRISMELDSAIDDRLPDYRANVLEAVQTAYEHTLDENQPLSPTTDQLAKRFNRELNIRRSVDACTRVMRSPSARKIGNIRRRSRERVQAARRLTRNKSFQEVSISGITAQDINVDNVVPDNAKRDNTRIMNKSQQSPYSCCKRVTRSSSLHISNSSLGSTYPSILSDNWTSAEGFFHSSSSPSIRTPGVSLEKCRASIAKLRSQNAGMVLAKARLFDNLVDSDTSANVSVADVAQPAMPTTFSANTVQTTSSPKVAFNSRSVRNRSTRDAPDRRSRGARPTVENRSRTGGVDSPRKLHRGSALVTTRSPGVSVGRRRNNAAHRIHRIQLLKENSRNDTLVDFNAAFSRSGCHDISSTASPKCTTPKNMPPIKKTLTSKSARRLHRTPQSAGDFMKTPLKYLNKLPNTTAKPCFGTKLSKMRALGISLLSVALTVVVVANAFYQKKQFYPSIVYITKSNPSLAVIYIQAFICVLFAGKLMRKIFFGELRASEFEHLMERFWYAITETCLAFTVFRDDFNPKFVALFTMLLFLKSFHWLAEDRVDYMERSPIISVLFHLRALSLLVVLGSLDLHFIWHAYESTVTKGASVQLVFGFEYAILLTMVINVAIKYALYSVDLYSETPWDNKAVFLLYTELVMGLIKVMLYLAFVGIMVRIYTLPLFALRPMYYTIRNFKKALNDVILSRRAIHNMNTLYPNATQAELQAGDNVCIICREEMQSAAKKLPCNHIFHAACLRSWFQRQQTCPTCRLNILRPTVTPGATAAPQPAAAPGNAARVDRPRLNLNNPFLNMNFNGANPFQILNPNFRNLAAAANNIPQQEQGAAEGGATPTNQPGSQQQTQMPPMPPPPFPLLSPLLIPPAMPPPNISNLTTEQLRQMESNERENIEARIAWLRSIQVMLDTAVVMLQQYNTAAAYARVAATATSAASDAAASASTSASTEPSTSGTAETAANTDPTGEQSSSGNKTAETIASTSKETTPAEREGTSTVQDLPSTSAASGASASNDDEIRRRRLQRFEQTAGDAP